MYYKFNANACTFLSFLFPALPSRICVRPNHLSRPSTYHPRSVCSWNKSETLRKWLVCDNFYGTKSCVKILLGSQLMPLLKGAVLQSKSWLGGKVGPFLYAYFSKSHPPIGCRPRWLPRVTADMSLGSTHTEVWCTCIKGPSDRTVLPISWSVYEKLVGTCERRGRREQLA